MTMPSGSAGLDPNAWLAPFMVKNNAAALMSRDRASIENYYRSQIQGSNAWQEASDKFWADIMAGFEDLNEFLTLLVNAITGQAGGWQALSDYFAEQWANIATALEDSWNWLAALVEDLFILLDLLHLVYPTGAPSDARDRKIDGKRTWYSAWNDLMYLLGIAKDGSVTPPSPGNAGQVVQDAQDTADAAGQVADFASGTAVIADGKATQSKDWLTQLFEDLTILFDVFHFSYPVGDVNDSPSRTINGKRTWYAAWNRLWGLHVDAASIPTPPPAPTVKDAKAELDAAREIGESTRDAIIESAGITPAPGSEVDQLQVVLASLPGANVTGPSGLSVSDALQAIIDNILSGLTQDEVTDGSLSELGNLLASLSNLVKALGVIAGQAYSAAVVQPVWQSYNPMAVTSVPMTGRPSIAEGNVPFKLRGATTQTGIGAFLTVPTPSKFNYIDIQALPSPTNLASVDVEIWALASDQKMRFLRTISATNIPRSETAGSDLSLHWYRVSISPVLEVPAGALLAINVRNKSTSYDYNFAMVPCLSVLNQEVQVVVPSAGYVMKSEYTPTAGMEMPAFTAAAGIPVLAIGNTSGRTSSNPTEVKFADSGTVSPPTWWKPGTDIVDVIAVGGGGAGGSAAGNGAPGSDIIVKTGATTVLTADGGAGGAGGFGSSSISYATGQSPGSYRFSSTIFQGGAPASRGVTSVPGNSPGGGSSGNTNGFASYWQGGRAGKWNTASNVAGSGEFTVSGGSGGGGVPGATFSGGRGRAWFIYKQGG